MFCCVQIVKCRSKIVGSKAGDSLQDLLSIGPSHFNHSGLRDNGVYLGSISRRFRSAVSSCQNVIQAPRHFVIARIDLTFTHDEGSSSTAGTPLNLY